MSTEIWLSTKAKNRRVELSQSVPERLNNIPFLVTIECQDPISKTACKNGSKDKTAYRRENLSFTTTAKDGRVRISVPVPESWIPLPDIDGDYINITLECEDIIENKSVKGYCPICGDQVDLEFDGQMEKDNKNYDKIYVINCIKCNKRLVIYTLIGYSDLKGNFLNTSTHNFSNYDGRSF